MRSNKFYMTTLAACAVSIVLLGAAQSVYAQGNSNGQGNANGNGNNIGRGNASDGIMGMIVTDKRIYYSGDALEISLRFPRGADIVSSGEVDASILIFTADEGAEPIVVPVSSEASPTKRKIFEVEQVDISALPAGQYQLGLVLTVPDGDPLMIADWHKGLLGLIDVIGIRIADEAQADDEDGDGM
ncbi:MAG: hypothetical protein Q8L60_16320, partial [Gammaproteobacteria bacterium]|nr:hypothetical protein [Gammaproteobacteria bacterium]